MHMQIIKWICILWSAYAYNPMHIIKFIRIKSNTLWIDIRWSRLPFLIDWETFECSFSSSSFHTHVVGIAELLSDSGRWTQHCQTSTVDSPTQPWSSWTSCSAVRISHPVQYSQRKFLPRNKCERESINSVQAPHSKIVNQPVRAPTTQSSIVSSDGVSEIEKFGVNLVRVMSEYSTRLRKNHQCLRGRTPCLHSNINEFLSEPLQSWHTQQRHSMSEEALFEHSHKGTRPHYQSGSSPIPGK